jgi:hypothetical protein
MEGKKGEGKVVYWMGFGLCALISSIMFGLYGWLALFLLALYSFPMFMVSIGIDAMVEEREKDDYKDA